MASELPSPWQKFSVVVRNARKQMNNAVASSSHRPSSLDGGQAPAVSSSWDREEPSDACT
jgi:hypothetical protein